MHLLFRETNAKALACLQKLRNSQKSDASFLYKQLRLPRIAASCLFGQCVYIYSKMKKICRDSKLRACTYYGVKAPRRLKEATTHYNRSSLKLHDFLRLANFWHKLPLSIYQTVDLRIYLCLCVYTSLVIRKRFNYRLLDDV